MNTRILEKIFTVNLGVDKDERVLVFTDISEIETHDNVLTKAAELEEIAALTAEVGKNHCKTQFLEFTAVDSHGSEPPEIVWKAAFGKNAVKELEWAGVLTSILNKVASEEQLKKATYIIESYKEEAVDCIIALSSNSTSHTNFRKWLTGIAGTRYASMPLFETDMIVGVMTADWEAVAERTLRLKEMMSGGDSVHITARNGTDIRFSIKGQEVSADTGILTEKGSFSNLPAGEAFLAPVEGTAKGKLVLNWAPTRELSSPITLQVSKGMVTEIIGNEDHVAVLERAIEKHPLAANIAELGVGTNEKADRPNNILETEKILGTIHIALGDNSSFGGTVIVPFHQDYVFYKSTLLIKKTDGEVVTILKDGEPQF
ncbi:MAG: aminopeptidase [Thermodesulfobacteriota bacterium]